MRDEGQGDARDRRQAHVHADVLDHLREQDHGRTGAQQEPEAVRCDRGRPRHPVEEDREQSQQQQAAEQSELLRIDGEDKVGGALRDVAELALEAVQPALAEDPARPDRDARLDQVVAGTQRVLGGVEEDLQALALVAPQQVRQQRYRDRDTGQDRGQDQPRRPRQEEQAQQQGGEDVGGAEIGLVKHEQRRRQAEDAQHQHLAPAGGLSPRQKGRQGHQDQQLGDLRRLHLEAGHPDPALGAVGRVPGHLDRYQQQQHQPVQVRRGRLQTPVVEGGGGHVEQQAGRDAPHLGREVCARGREQRHQPQHHQGRQGQRLRQVSSAYQGSGRGGCSSSRRS